MDTSDEYIIMCDLSQEIQNAWCLHDGDVLYSHKQKTWWIWLVTDDTVTPPLETAIWLPQQDQLQDMLSGTYHDNLRTMYYVLSEMGTDTKFNNFKSFEQLWFGIVMYDIYGKCWNGKNWIDKDLAESMQYNDSLMKKLSKL